MQIYYYIYIYIYICLVTVKLQFVNRKYLGSLDLCVLHLHEGFEGLQKSLSFCETCYTHNLQPTTKPVPSFYFVTSVS
jgi:hypothetical protein